ncbi:MAG: amino acid adenylation domain-containing protein [Rhizonema sp. NSF051]|nr:amino acid adenylation domain-containing protein [Rhizonema sp. NSF051]
MHKNNECTKQLYKLQDYFTWESIAESYPNTLRFFPVCFDWEEFPENSVAANVSFSIYQLYSCIERFNVKLSCTLQNDSLSVAFHYDLNLFHVEDIKRLVKQFQTLLASAIAHPDTAISQLEILSPIERKQLLDQVNNTKRDYPQNKCIHHLFEEQAQKTPNKVAIVFDDQQLTYHELNQRANRIAHYLQKQGVAPEVLVGLCVERSLDMIVGLLAILKAGGAYVPLDPALPKEGLALRLQDLQVSLVISHSSLVNNFEPMANNFEQITVIYLDSDWQTIAQENEVNLNTKVTSENLVYALFTSGSTGRPKGVAIEHKQLLNYLYAIIDRLNLPAGTNFALVSTFAADLGNTVIFPSLCTGGCLHIISYECATDLAALAEYCHRHPIDCLKIVPSHLASLLTSSSPKSILPQKRLILGGEATSWELVEQIQSYAQDCQIFNHYGPTEATVGVLTYLVELNEDLFYNQKSRTVPLGRSIPNTQVYVLEENLQLVPIGVSGEIYIGGITLARCYLNQPQQTAVKFIPNPFSQEEGARLYKTGDQARYLPDGTIEFLGRIDHQVKIRGFRVELGEIEAVLTLHPNVREVVVLARDSESGQNYLAAYVVPYQESPILINELRNYVQARLPEYMVPSTFVILKALPLTPNGKVDRQALAVPNQVRPELETSFTTPRTPAEEVLAGIWARVLGTEHVGIHDNFFDLGGHSLLATQVVSQIREAFQVELRLRSLFETPTVAGLAELIDTVVRAGQKLELPPIENVSRDIELPLSFAQQRLWFLDQLEPGNPFYNISRAVILKGSLNVTALEQSLNEIVRRHEVLRTNFRDVDGYPVQEIASALNITLPIIDLGELLEEQEAEVHRLARSQARQSFDLTQDALLGTTLLRLDEEEHVLVFTIHHIVADGWSTGVIIHEITALYESFCSGNPSSLPELPVQYADFAIWQRQWLQTAQSSQKTYWKQQLGGNLPVLQLPTDRPRPAIQTFRGRKQPWQISKALTEALKSLSHREAVTLFMTLLAAFKTLLYRYTNQADILIGSPIANRNCTSKIENLIGFFVNTLVLRTDLSGNPSFKELLQRVRQVTLDAYAHQDLPFEQLVEELQPERNLSYTPLFQVGFAFLNAPIEELKLPDLSLSPMEVEPETSLFDITVFLRETEQGLTGVFEYNSDVFDTATIERMQGHFQTLLEGIVANSDQHLFDLPILSATEKQQLLVDWNQTSPDHPSICIHQLFEAQVEQTPNAIAVVFEDQQLTYQELNFRANQLAHYLRSLGVGPEVLVGIFVERSLDMVIGLLGILKAGGAYVPLDAAYPQERLAFILQDAQMPVLLTQQRLMENLPESQTRTVCLDTDWGSIAKECQQNLISKCTTDNLAYIIYTSGSTGQPKGVLVDHANVVRLFVATESWYHFNQQDVLSLFHSYAFDFSVWELWGALLYGGKLVVVSYWLSRSPEDFYKLLSTQQVTVLNQTPSAFRQLIQAEESLGDANNLSLRLVIFGGEALELQSLRPWFERHGDQFPQLVNMYGITETTVHVTYRKLTMADLEATCGSVIGRPIRDLQIYLLDQYGQPVPIGVDGEMYVGGAGVARGYLNRSQLTAERFIPNYFSDQPNVRLYKSGDKARYLPNGDIEYLGRIDYQVKIRGFRIELGDIEAVLVGHPAVQETVVLDQDDKHGDKRLVAFVVAFYANNPLKAKWTRDLVPQLRRFLQQKLPEYMVPSTFVTLEALPLTPNGKVDRRTLAASGITQIESEEIFVAPSNPVEEILAGIWAEVLDLDKVGIHSNFFELGGHSLLATRVISQIQKVFEVKLPLHRLFDKPTVAELATEIEKASKVDSGLDATNIERISRSQELPLSFAQQRLWFLTQLEPESPLYNMPAAICLEGQLNLIALEQSFNEILCRHEALRTNFKTVEGQPIAVISSMTLLLLPILDLSELPFEQQDSTVRQLILVEAQQPFDLKSELLLRVRLLRLSKQKHIVLVTMHHIASDGWSIGVLVREVIALYEAFCAEKPSPLSELPIQYADFAVWQRQRLQGKTLEAQLSYWKQQLGNNLPVLELPTTRPRTEVKTNKGATQSFLIPSNVSQGLQALSRQQGVTLFMTLLASFQIFLQRYTNQDDIVVGTDVANRNRAETELLIGFFINLLVLRTDLSGNPSFQDLLKRVRSVALGAYAHQDLPFEELVKALQPERNLRNISPLFQVLFVLQNAPMPPLELPGLTLSQLEVENKVARFDLALFLTETEQGILGKWQYNADLFAPITITRMASHFETLLNSIISQPDARLSNLEMLTEEERKQQVIQKRERKAFNRQKFISIAPKAVSLSAEKLVVTDYLQPGQTFPLVIQPATRDIDLVAWAKTNQEFIETELLKHGAILFRDFNVYSVSEFESIAQAICPDLFGEYGDLPRAGESGKVYGSTPYPPDKAILFHNESSHLHQWPLKIWFFCVQPAQKGGNTPIVDCRKAYKILSPKLRKKLAQKQFMYVRNYTEGLDVSWQNFFRTNDKPEVENYCRQSQIDFEWYDNNGLITRQIRPALAVHPKTGEPVFFNQIQLHHIAYLDADVRDSLLSTFGDKKLPRNVYYGDGTSIENEVITEINEVYQQSQMSFPWQKGDILMLDNMLTAHGRNSYLGDRKIVVTMGEMIQGV